MALISCPDCNKDVSDKAEKCLNCGAPIASHLNSASMKSIEIEITPDITLNEKFNNEYETDKKSPAIAIILALVFGPFGTFYVSIGAGFAMLVVCFFALFGGPIGYLITIIVNMFICYIFANESNEKLKSSLLLKQNKEKKIIKELEVEKQEKLIIDNTEYTGL